MSDVSYPPDEFLAHCSDLLPGRPGNGDSFFARVSRVSDYMQDCYRNRTEASYRASRFMLIMEYVASHDQFDRDDFAVVGSDDSGSLVGDHVLLAVHEIFTSAPLPRGELDPGAVMILARAIRDADDAGTADDT